jgi:hypothetical protein
MAMLQSNLQIQNTNDFLHKTRKNQSQVHMTARKTLNSQTILSKKAMLEASQF